MAHKSLRRWVLPKDKQFAWNVVGSQEREEAEQFHGFGNFSLEPVETSTFQVVAMAYGITFGGPDSGVSLESSQILSNRNSRRLNICGRLFQGKWEIA